MYGIHSVVLATKIRAFPAVIHVIIKMRDQSHGSGAKK